MDLRKEILREHSKAQAIQIAHYIGDDKQRFGSLMHLFLNDEYRVCQRSAWVVSIIAENSPELLLPFIQPMLENLKNNNNHAVVRNTVRVLNHLKEIPESSIGLATSICFDFLSNPSKPIAIRVFSIHFLYKICVKEPDLKEELQILLEDILPYASPALVSAGKNILLKLNKMPRKNEA